MGMDNLDFKQEWILFLEHYLIIQVIYSSFKSIGKCGEVFCCCSLMKGTLMFTWPPDYLEKLKVRENNHKLLV